jgi:thiol-disulfide isomerase/thioredoxin
MNQSEAKSNLRALKGRINWGIILLFAGFCLLFALASHSHGGTVKEVNSGRPGETLDLKTLPVQGKTTLVDVYSPYCPPCLRLASLLEKLAQQRQDLAIKKVNIQRPEIKGKIDWKSPLARQLNLHAIPYFLIYDRKGKLIAEGKEARPQVLQWLDEAGLLQKKEAPDETAVQSGLRTILYQVAVNRRQIAGAHPDVRPQARADTWVRPYGKIAD